MPNNASHKGGGRVSTAPNEKQMAAYDALPKSVRETLANALFDWPAYPIRKSWERGYYKTAKELSQRIRQWDKNELKRSKTK